MVNHADVGFKLGWQVVLLPDTGDALEVFPGALGVCTAQLIAARASMGVQVEKRFIFLFERLDNQALNGMFKNVGVVARVKAVAITEHG